MPPIKTRADAPPHLHWMAQTAEIEALRIDELILPGSHNSGSDKQSPGISVPQERAQDVAPLEQLRQGVRVLDLRVSFYGRYAAGHPNRFQIFHLTSSGRTVAVDILQRIEEFYQELEESGTTAREMVILDFHQLEGFTTAAHQELQALLTTRLGSRLLPHALRHLSLKEIWALHPGKNVVVAYNHGASGELLWNGVEQRWPGTNLFNTNALKTFVDNVALEYKAEHRLKAVQCAKYSLPLHAPTDLSEKVDQWFKSVDENSYIQNFYIINTDWTLRSQLVAQCRHANRLRAVRKLHHPDQPLQPKLRLVSNA